MIAEDGGSARTVAETADWWDRRHRQFDELRSGGHSGLDEQSNEILYALRLGKLVEIIGDGSLPAAPLRMLDAGCGRGIFARAMGRFGHAVDGIDVSSFAVDWCRARSGPLERYEVSALHEWCPPYLYDVVYSIDVLFHIMEDETWEASLSRLGSLVRWGGLIVAAEHESTEDRTWSVYQRTRRPARYVDCLSSLGFRLEGFVPIRFRNGPVGFLVLRRAGS
jgi:2-polyprenyl-3-methyl-5-hydroxy-6-metoxy-1,4-benzoquinol methylase